MAVDEMQERIEALENRVVDLESKLYQRNKDAAYVFIHSNWHLIRWYLNRQRDINGEGSDIYARALNGRKFWLSKDVRQVDPVATFLYDRHGLQPRRIGHTS